ncbi:type III pantothenate kinase [Marinobacter sp. ANT_B65]|uniref:type III pantothenate kinase n=1 Tax=Marinobacter sp. ANT_B65 TaxID=2039467 RepID=UPI000BBE44EB|nr:type III pantothenate kinase [Marinobacter sp. ANT_B65]PCM42861.1 type III pantothenate kinase [Marinobacter sp. ANT_B65]
MKLLIDAGNTRLKWRLEQDGLVLDEGWSALGGGDPLVGIEGRLDAVSRVGVSTVIREEKRLELLAYLQQKVSAPVNFHWAEARRCGLQNSYADVKTMGADRWHGMYGAWKRCKSGYAVIDAGSAITVDYVNSTGEHLGGYILPGLKMMLRSLKSDAARILFEAGALSGSDPGKSTAECVNQGLSWLSRAMIERVGRDMSDLGLSQALVTGGDAGRLLQLGLEGAHYPSLVLEGLSYIDREMAGE